MSSGVACSSTEPRQENTSHPARKKFESENKSMDPAIQATVGTKRNNKENTKPANGRSVPATNKVQKRTAPRRYKNDKVGENAGESGDELKKAQAGPGAKMHPSGKEDVVRRQTLSQAFLSQHNSQQRNLVLGTAKPPASVPPKPLPGTYKGRVIQSKVSSFRKPAGAGGEAEPATAPSLQANRSACNKPQAAIGVRGKPPAAANKTLSFLKPSAAPSFRSKSVSSGALAPVTQRAPNASAPRDPAPRARLHSAPAPLARGRVWVPPARPESAARPGSGKSAVSLKRKELQQAGKHKAMVVTAGATDKKPPKAAVTSSLSQYRTTMETADERKAKLAEWLASKGKALKRPPIASTLPQAARRPAPSKPVPKPEAAAVTAQDPEAEPDSRQDLDLETQPVERPQSSPEAEAEAEAKPETETTGVPATAPCPGSDIMNTTLDLLENSEMDLPVDPETRMDDVVVNLCNAMEALQGPSTCKNDEPASGDGDGEILEENLMDMLAETSREEVDLEEEKRGIKEVKNEGAAEGKSSAKRGVKTERGDEEDEAETPSKEAEGASVVRYSVKTTPYLQSVKQRIQSEAPPPGSGGRRRSAIKDLKFLTPVRRSLRIQRESGRLPGMLADHDPSVASLAELARLDEDANAANAYIYRRNPALLEALPDQPEGPAPF